MEYTNKYQIPDELAAAIAVDHYTDPNDKPCDYSVTNLLNPIQQSELIRRYKDSDDFPKRDILDSFNAWVGSVIHNSIEDAWKEGMTSVVEERLYMDINGKTISGKLDCLDTESGTITDWKTCKIYKVQKEDYLEWERQANSYALLARHNGYEVSKLQIIAIILDWKKNEAKYKKNYPETPIVPIELNIWPQSERIAYLKERIMMREMAKKMTDKELAERIPCSRYDQWSSFQGCAMTKEGNTKATKVFASRAEAEDYVAENPKFKEYKLEERYTQRTRCIDYCSAKPFCHQYRNETIGAEQKLKI